jgi:hypothetical protein
VIGLSFLDLSNTSRYKEFPRDVCSQDVEGSGDTMLLHVIVGFLELPFWHFYRVLLYSQLTVWCNHDYQSLCWVYGCAFVLLLFSLLLEDKWHLHHLDWQTPGSWIPECMPILMSFLLGLRCSDSNIGQKSS